MPHTHKPGQVSSAIKGKGNSGQHNKANQGVPERQDSEAGRQVEAGKQRDDVEDRPQSNEDQRQGNAREDAEDKSRKDRYKEDF